MRSEESISRETPLRKIASLVSSIIAWNEGSVSDVILFGSVARGEENVESDVDLLVLVEGSEGWAIRRRLYDLIYPIITSLGVDISLIVIEKKQFVKMVKAGEPFAKSVLIDGVQLYGMLAEHHRGSFTEGLRKIEGC
ncbi:MAG: nucleotidyltransferase domain-containing protein [Candidatus Bathyarchaeia archaeon]